MHGSVFFFHLEHAVEPLVQVNHRRKEMSDELRKLVFQTLLVRSKNGKLGKKDTSIVAAQFGLGIQSVQRLWKRGKIQLANSIPVVVSSLKKGRVGRKKIPVDLEALRSIPLKERTTIEDVSAKLNMSKSKIQRYLRKGFLRCHSSSIKPYLTETNKKSRLKWCVDMIKRDLHGGPRFKDFFDLVFIDEKWFYLSQKSEKYYLLPEQDYPHRTCKNKNYIPRLMFLCVCAQPRFRDGNCIFDGRIGCFPLVTYQPAMRGNVRTGRVHGDLVMKPITSITREVIRDFMINKVLPAIRAKWPKEDVGKPIFIQQDNAPSHLKLDDPDFCEHAKQEGFDIRLICQPPNSPDFNILDLDFFRAIQAIQYKKNAKTIEALVPTVEEAFMEYSAHKANRMFVTLQSVLMEAMKQQFLDSTHAKRNIRKRRSAANFSPLRTIFAR
nr:mar19 transposase [synthetic construct]